MRIHMAHLTVALLVEPPSASNCSTLLRPINKSHLFFSIVVCFVSGRTEELLAPLV